MQSADDTTATTASSRPPGRASTYSVEMADRIVEWVAEGKPLREFCRLDDTPAWRTVYDWLDANPDFAARFARARDLGADAIAEETLRIADTPMQGQRSEVSEDGLKTVTEDMLGHRKLQVDTRLKLLAKWFPKRYGDRKTTEHTGSVSIQAAVTDESL